MAYRGLTIIFASFLIFLGQFGYSNGECADGGCNATDLGTPEYLKAESESEPDSEDCYSNGTSVTLSCEQPAWPLEEEYENTCNNGIWENDPVTCKVYCSAPVVANLTLEPNQMRYDVGDEVTFSCEKGYKLTSDSPTSAQCNDMGNLNPTQELECIAFSCSAPTNTTDYLTWTDKGKQTYNGNETITYSCSEELKVDGYKTNTCIDQDEWKNEDPTCSSGNVVQVFSYFLLMTTFYSVFSFYM